MAGRPRKMVRRVEEFEKLVTMLAMYTFETIPEQYREKPNPNDRLSVARNNAMRLTMHTSIALDALGDLLRAKAGITEPGPSAQFWSDPPDGAELASERAGKG